MTEAELKQAEKDAESDAEWLALLLLLYFRKKDRQGVEIVTFDSAKGRFYYNGKSVSVTQIRKYLNRIETRYAKRLDRITQQLMNDEITVAEWKREFDRSISSMHILAGALALGGIAVSARNAAVQAAIASETAFADEFAKAVRKNKAGTVAQVRSRARSYVRSILMTYANTELEARRLMGTQTEARRIRRASESCKGCIEWAKRGWVPIDIMPRLGSLQCRIYCRCYIEYR